jgi:ferritin
MASEDLKPNRLEYAKKEIIKLIKNVNKPIGIFSFDKNINLLSLPTMDKTLLINKIKPLKPVKARTDILMAINRVKYISSAKKTIVLISDGGEKEVKGDFIFWGFATSKGAKVPGFDGISKLNIIGDKYFSYKDTNKLIKYLNSHTLYTEKKVTIYKPISYIFSILAFISFTIGVILSRFKILVILLFIFPHQAKANDILGCLYEYVGLKKAAIKEFKNSNTDLANMKMSIYYLKKGEYKHALKKINKVKNNPQKNYIKALILTKQKKYKKAFETLQNSALYKNSLKLYNLLKKYITNNSKSVIHEIKDFNTQNKISKTKKEPLW